MGEVFETWASLSLAASFSVLLVFASDSEPEVDTASFFFGQVLALCPGIPQMLYFRDIV